MPAEASIASVPQVLSQRTWESLRREWLRDVESEIVTWELCHALASEMTYPDAAVTRATEVAMRSAIRGVVDAAPVETRAEWAVHYGLVVPFPEYAAAAAGYRRPPRPGSLAALPVEAFWRLAGIAGLVIIVSWLLAELQLTLR